MRKLLIFDLLIIIALLACGANLVYENADLRSTIQAQEREIRNLQGTVRDNLDTIHAMGIRPPAMEDKN